MKLNLKIINLFLSLIQKLNLCDYKYLYADIHRLYAKTRFVWVYDEGCGYIGQ